MYTIKIFSKLLATLALPSILAAPYNRYYYNRVARYTYPDPEVYYNPYYNDAPLLSAGYNAGFNPSSSSRERNHPGFNEPMVYSATEGDFIGNGNGNSFGNSNSNNNNNQQHHLLDTSLNLKIL